jgi:uncharacterized protein YbjQ (UPF0145 family)
MATVANEIHGFRLRSLGIVMGTAMRDPIALEIWKSKRPAVIASFEQARQQALHAMMTNALQQGGNGVIAVRFDELSMTGAAASLTGAQPTLVFAIGTAVWAEP